MRKLERITQKGAPVLGKMIRLNKDLAHVFESIKKWHALSLIVLISLISTPIYAQSQKSVYTDINLKKCPLIASSKPGDGEWAQWRCKGLNGTRVNIHEGDLRFFLSYGRNGKKQTVATQTLSPFNTIGKKLEWRVKKHNNRWRPYATILRYYTQTGSNGEKGQILVVTKITRTNACHIAYIDALANENANALARDVADNQTRSFNCKTEQPKVIGKSGISPM